MPTNSELTVNIDDEKERAYLLSAASIAVGLFLIANPGGWLVAAMAGAFMGVGTSGAIYTVKTPDSDFKAEEFMRQAAVGGVGGLLTGGIASGATIPALLAGGAVGGVGSKTTETLTKFKRLPTCEEVIQQASIGMVSAGMGAGASKIVGSIVGEVSDDLLAHFCKGGVEGAASGVATKIVDNVGHNLTQDEKGEKKALFDGMGPAMLQGCIIGGLVAASKQVAKTQDSANGSNESDKDSQESKESEISNIDEVPEPGQPKIECTTMASPQPKIVIDALTDHMNKGFQPSDNNLQNSPHHIIEQVDIGEHVTLKHHSERIKVYRDGNAIVFKFNHGQKTRYNVPVNRVAPQNLQSTPPDTLLNESNNGPVGSEKPEPLSAHALLSTTEPSSKGLKVYVFSRPLKKLPGYGALLFEKARHVGFIVDHPEHGLILFENTGKPGEGSSFRGIKIDEYHAQTNASKGRWLYEVGVTNMSLEEIGQLAFDWIAKFPDYKWYSDNCRRFVNEILRKMLPSAEHLNFSINHSDFKKNPCNTIEALVRDVGFNVSNHLCSQSENSYKVQ